MTDQELRDAKLPLDVDIEPYGKGKFDIPYHWKTIHYGKWSFKWNDWLGRHEVIRDEN